MKKNIICGVLALAMLLTGTLSAAESATIVTAQGQVTITMQGASEATAAVINQELPAGTKIATGQDGSAAIKLDDGTTITMAPNSAMEISPYNRKESKKNSILLFLGSIWSKVTKSFDGKISYVVSTPNAVAGVRGTEFNVTVALDGAIRVQVKEGIVGVGEEEAKLQNEVKAHEQVCGDDKGVGKNSQYAEDKADNWQQDHATNLQKNGKKIGARVESKVKANQTKIAKINKELKRALTIKDEYIKQIKLGDKEATVKLKMIQVTIDDLLDQRAALANQAASQVALYDHFVELANDSRFNMVGAETIKANAASLYAIKKDLDAMVSYGTDLSMETMDKMLEEYSSGARNTLKEKDHSAADELFKSTPDMDF